MHTHTHTHTHIHSHTHTHTHTHIHTHTHTQKKTEGQVLFEQIIRRLELTQKEYFGLEFEDEHKTPVR